MTASLDPHPRSVSGCILTPVLTTVLVTTILWIIAVTFLKRSESDFLTDFLIALGSIIIHLVLDRSIDQFCRRRHR